MKKIGGHPNNTGHPAAAGGGMAIYFVREGTVLGQAEGGGGVGGVGVTQEASELNPPLRCKGANISTVL